MASGEPKLPPGEFGAPLVGESLDFLAEPVEFVKRKYEKYGNIFKTNVFGRETVMIGGVENVQEFLKIEPKITTSSLPETFVKLHTEYGALNMSGEKLRTTRANLGKVLGPAAMKAYLPVIEDCSERFMDEVLTTKRMALTPDLERLCIQMYAEMLLGRTIPEDLQADFRTYNDGLVGLLPLDVPFTAFGKGSRALERLLAFITAHIEEVEASGRLHSDERYFCMRELMTSVDETGEPYSRERVATSLVLLVWGAYAEAASLIADVIYKLMSEPRAITVAMRQEMQAVLGGGEPLTLAMADRMEYTEAVCNETLRVLPPSGGGMRMASEDVEIGGYTIPAGWVISADPRISNNSPDVFDQPEKYMPERFLSGGCPFGFGSGGDDGKTDELRAQYELCQAGGGQLPEGAWFPGGIGSHKCPGVPLAMLSAKVTLAKFLERFESWEPESDAEPNWKVLPIKTLADDYTIKLTPRSPVGVTTVAEKVQTKVTTTNNV